LPRFRQALAMTLRDFSANCQGILFFVLDIRKQNVYSLSMIRSFAASETERFFATGKSRRLPQDILKRAACV
jgi:hypothetical protein